jgi:4-cresol dehydrogenase (hydroxylating)
VTQPSHTQPANRTTSWNATTGANSGEAEQQAALDAAAALVGSDRISAGLGDNTGLFRHRDVLGVVRPRSAKEVRRLVEIFGGTAPLHVFSTGRNWGLGSREPADDGVVALDLSDLDQVRALAIDSGWAIVEPGVTQGRMAGLLAGTGRMVNVTVSSAHSSVLGNALDRGVGLRHQRVEDLMGLEVVLPDGDMIRVGWWPDAERRAAVYPHGLGPSLVQLFVQSNLGIVTAATIRLLPRPEALRVLRLEFEPDRLAGAVAHLRRWVAQGLVGGVLKVYDPVAARGYGITSGRFLAHVCVDGTARSVEALAGVITAEARESGVFAEVSATDATDPAAPHHEVTSLVERSYAGDPDVTDTVFEAKMGMPADQLDERMGFLFFLPLVPFDPDSLTTADTLLHEIRAETGIGCGATLNVLGPDVVDLVVAMKFDRGSQAGPAHRALDLLYERFTAAGFLPYRLDVDHHDWIDRCDHDPAARAFVRRLKEMVDPASVIAPGRYF